LRRHRAGQCVCIDETIFGKSLFKAWGVLKEKVFMKMGMSINTALNGVLGGCPFARTGLKTQSTNLGSICFQALSTQKVFLSFGLFAHHQCQRSLLWSYHPSVFAVRVIHVPRLFRHEP
jgi:hypothetical protein